METWQPSLTIERDDAIDRIIAHLDASGPCWLWTRCTTKQGYGSIRIQGKSYTTHRLLWHLLVGPIPKGRKWVLDHHCRVKRCCNPDHMQVVRQRENMRRGARHKINGKWSACGKGHPFTPDNTRLNAKGSQVCRTCKRITARKIRARRKAVVSVG